MSSATTRERSSGLGQRASRSIATPEQGPALWEELSGQATPAGSACWEWLEIHAGIPVILPQTQEQFTPQMANFEAIGGVSFTKGCYTGHSDTQTLGAKAVNETRFQYLRDNSGQTPISTALGINVLGEFTQGGAVSGTESDHQDHYELQNYTSISQGKHFIKFGGRLRAIHEVSMSSAGFNGTYTFSSLDNYNNGVPHQYSVNATQSGVVPTVPVTLVDAGLYVQDDWKLRPNLTLSGGLRFETQSAIHDHGDWAPRLGFAWGIGGGGRALRKPYYAAGLDCSTTVSGKT